MVDNGVQAISIDDTQDTEEIGERLEKQIASGLDPDIALVFASSEIDAKSLNDELDSRLDFDYAGASTAGEITSEGPKTGSLAALIIDRNDIDFTVSTKDRMHENPSEKGKELAEACIDSLEEHENRGLLLITPGITQTDDNIEFKVLKGITSAVPSDMPISGGSAGDDVNLRQTYQFANGELMKDGSIAVGISTDHGITSVQEHGKDEVVATGVVTESDGKEIIRVGEKSAAEFYADAIGEDISELKSLYDLPLGEKIKQGAVFLKNYLMRKDPIMIGKIFRYSLDHSIAEELGPGQEIISQPIYITRRNGIVVSKKMEETQVIKILKGERESIITAGEEAASRADDPLFGVFADCATRRLLLEEEERKEEVDEIAEIMGQDFIGWYAMGEIGQNDNMICTFMNQTVSGMIVEEKD